VHVLYEKDDGAPQRVPRKRRIDGFQQPACRLRGHSLGTAFKRKAVEQRACPRIARQGTIALDLLEQLAERAKGCLDELDAASGSGGRPAAIHALLELAQ
jgi:hypothetical protein